MTNPKQVANLPIGSLSPNPWNTNVVSPENLEKIKESLKRFEMFRPILVRETDGQLQIIGGYHRWLAAKDMGYAEVPVFNFGAIDDKKAKEIGLVDNGRYGEDDTLRLASLLKELGGAEDVSLYMPYSDAELDSIFLAEEIALDDIGMDDSGLELEEMVQQAGKAVQTHQIMRFKIPMEDSEFITKIIEATMRNQGFSDDDALSNAGNALVHLLKGLK